MKSWIKNKLKLYFLVPNEHTINQVILLLESKMPYEAIKKSCHLSQASLEAFVADAFVKQKPTYDKLRSSFSQHQLLILFRDLQHFNKQVRKNIIKKSAYPSLMVFLSYGVFLLFYFVIYPLFLSMNQTYERTLFKVYTYGSFIILMILVLGIILLWCISSSSYQSTLILRALQNRYPHWLIFDYFTIKFVLIYKICLTHNYSSLMTIAILRGYLDSPFLKAVAFEIEDQCQKGIPLHDAIKGQNLSLLLNQTIDLGMAANDLSHYISNLSNHYLDFLLTKLNQFCFKYNCICYLIVCVHSFLIISILQMPTHIISDMF